MSYAYLFKYIIIGDTGELLQPFWSLDSGGRGERHFSTAVLFRATSLCWWEAVSVCNQT